MQVKDIPTEPILEFLGYINSPHQKCDGEDYAELTCARGIWGNWYFENSPHSVKLAMPENLPDKLVVAKMRNLIKKGLIDGCGCGCRGDYVLADKGKQVLVQE